MTVSLDTIANLAKRRGFVFPSSEIYGGLRSSYDYGPLGTELKRNIRDAWWRSMVQLRADVVGIDTAVIQARQVWVASGHESSFADLLVECRNCHSRFHQGHLADPDRCPSCGQAGTFTDARQFNLMFKTYSGPVEDESALVYLRPETAQGIFINWAAVQTTSRRKLPFGIAQVGKSFRNEITPGQFIFRTREFEQMEMEFFCHPEEAERWFEFWREERFRWYLDLGLREDNLRLRPHGSDELAHYAASCSDVEYRFPWGWGELEGIANRTDYDLRAHAETSGQDLRYFDMERDERYFPHVIEPAAGVDRSALAFLLDAYHEEEVRGEKRVVLRLHPRLAPYKVAVLPLSKHPDLVPVAERVVELVRPQWMTELDVTQSIGRRYRRQDEIGTPYCLTVDFETLEDQAVTVRDRDTMEQDRVPIEGLVEHLRKRFETIL
ncbi:MAG: glycine--tRNA ligase [Acidimicrobiia bacterium]